MMVVVDASVLVAATCDSGPDGVWAEAILELGDLAAPHLAPVEAAHDDLSRLEIDLLPYEPFADRVWELRANLTAYDAWCVAIAEMAGLPLATLDTRLARSAQPSCRFLTPQG
jgi:predicted nucleic acid-binding protein